MRIATRIFEGKKTLGKGSLYLVLLDHHGLLLCVVPTDPENQSRRYDAGTLERDKQTPLMPCELV